MNNDSCNHSTENQNEEDKVNEAYEEEESQENGVRVRSNIKAGSNPMYAGS